jgi:Heavy metal binding domain/Protein of unknown function (DUF3659)
MKNIIKVVAVSMLAIVASIQISIAQNYKAPKIDASGKITDKDGEVIGSITPAGEIKDAKGIKLAYVDGEGSLVDSQSGKKLGKAEKNGNFKAYYTADSSEEWSTSAPMNGTCLVKDSEGNVKAEVHENYKQFGACAIHCVTNHMVHSKVMDNKNSESAYVCPMHPEVTSDKPGKCSKCGMALVKRGK